MNSNKFLVLSCVSYWFQCYCTIGVDGCSPVASLCCLHLPYFFFSALTISRCSAWLLGHFSASLYRNWWVRLPSANIATPDPTPFSFFTSIRIDFHLVLNIVSFIVQLDSFSWVRTSRIAQWCIVQVILVFPSDDVVQLCHIFQFNCNWGYPCKHAEGFIWCCMLLPVWYLSVSGFFWFCGVAFPLHDFYPYLGTLISWNHLCHSRPITGLIYIFTLLWAGM